MDTAVGTLDERLLIVFPKAVASAEVDSFFQSLARGLRARITYSFEEKRHVGTTHPEIPLDEFITKTDIKGIINGSVIGLYVLPFSLEGHDAIGYDRMNVVPPPVIEFPANHWPDEYYRFAEDVRKQIVKYFNT